MTVTLNNAANDYVGETKINDSAVVGNTLTLALGADNQIPNGTGKGNVTISSFTTNATGIGTLSLAGFNETINGLNGNGNVSSATGTPTLTIGDNNATGSFSGVILNASRLRRSAVVRRHLVETAHSRELFP